MSEMLIDSSCLHKGDSALAKLDDIWSPQAAAQNTVEIIVNNPVNKSSIMG